MDGKNHRTSTDSKLRLWKFRRILLPYGFDMAGFVLQISVDIHLVGIFGEGQ